MFSKNTERERRVGGCCGWLDHHRTPSCERCARLASDHGVGEVPRGDGGGHANRLADHLDALVALVTGDDFAISPLAFFSEPLDEACAIGDFAFGFGQRLALFQRR